ncbi:MAG: hypothetical protein E6J07_03755 [Chloroflexi bacterium]|nr:MAG: hypothetical protein E6J07_03755 [Chloroflexota bacterium]TMF99268.1 MAG: hypothetical protein E6I10_02850 [Chloroflexota bacterium]
MPSCRRATERPRRSRPPASRQRRPARATAPRAPRRTAAAHRTRRTQLRSTRTGYPGRAR